VLRLPGSIVEPLISLSIVWIAAENLRPTLSGDRWRPLVVFGFGLLHGMGFASVLAELDAPQGSFLAGLLAFTGLLAFNLGIEGGQLAVIAAAAAVTALLRRHHWYRRRVVIPASIAIGMVATVWTVQRITTGG
jgi:predicted cation transporter